MENLEECWPFNLKSKYDTFKVLAMLVFHIFLDFRLGFSNKFAMVTNTSKLARA
jgi:hypothetical protein